MNRFPAEVYGGGPAMVATLLIGLATTAALAGACHLLGLPSGVLGGVCVVGVIGTQLLVMLSMRKRPATLAFEGDRLVLRKGAKELRSAVAGGAVGLARYVVPQVGVMGEVFVLGQPAMLTIGVMRSGQAAGANAPDVKKPDCFVTPDVFDRLAALVEVPAAHLAAAPPTRFQIFVNKSSGANVVKTIAYVWLLVMPLTAGASYLADLWLPSPLPAVVAGAMLLATGGAGVALLLRKRERSISFESGSLIVSEADRVIHAALLSTIAVKRVQHEISAKSLRYKLTGISLRFPDGSELALASRVPATWPGHVDDVKRSEPGWLIGPAELVPFARQLGIAESPVEGW